MFHRPKGDISLLHLQRWSIFYLFLAQLGRYSAHAAGALVVPSSGYKIRCHNNLIHHNLLAHSKDHTQDMVKMYVRPVRKWYQAPWSARLLIIFFSFFFNFPAGSLHCTCTSCPRWPVQCAEMLKTSTTSAVNISICELNTEIRVVLKIFWWVHCRCSRPGWPLHCWACSYFL